MVPIIRSTITPQIRAVFLLTVCVFGYAAFGQGEGADVQAEIAAAAQLYRDQKPEAAIAAFEQLVARVPENAVVRSWLGFLYLQADQPAKAVPHLEKAVSLRSNDVESLNNLGNAYLAVNEPDKAMATYRKVVAIAPTRYEPWYNIGNILLKRKAYREAIEAYRSAIERNQSDAFVYNNLGACYEGFGQWEDAAASYVKASQLRPDVMVFQRNAGMALSRLHRTQQAVPYLERAWASNRSDGPLALALASAYAATNELGKALGILEAVQDSMQGSASFWFNLGVLRSRAQDLKGAEEAYRKCLDIEPTSRDALNNYGLLLFGRGAYAEASNQFQKLLALEPGNIEAKLSLAASQFRSGDVPAAIELWKQVVRARPDDQAVRLDLASALWQSGDKAGARYHYAVVLKANPKSAPALNGIGLWHLDRDELKDAEARFRAAIAADPRYVSTYNNLAVTLERLNRRKEAIRVLERALQIDPKFQEAKDNLTRMKAAG